MHVKHDCPVTVEVYEKGQKVQKKLGPHLFGKIGWKDDQLPIVLNGEHKDCPYCHMDLYTSVQQDKKGNIVDCAPAQGVTVCTKEEVEILDAGWEPA